MLVGMLGFVGFFFFSSVIFHRADYLDGGTWHSSFIVDEREWELEAGSSFARHKFCDITETRRWISFLLKWTALFSSRKQVISRHKRITPPRWWQSALSFRTEYRLMGFEPSLCLVMDDGRAIGTRTNHLTFRLKLLNKPAELKEPN
ncbi:unnamed protein product [Protopolystoma xenopodis]|uniref:Uncharacterized protein n=1 Tax=Protopolystoma xenopodis TaxID=117903 RepID=A0A3S5A268_9PLAT|nr:unnamed protein product [Protopolystoma xenopodis]